MPVPSDLRIQSVHDNPNAEGVFLLDLNVGGRRYCLGTRDTHVPMFPAASPASSDMIHFVGAILNDVEYSEQIDVFQMSTSCSAPKFEVMAEFFPMEEFRESGVQLQDSVGDLYWHVDGVGWPLTWAIHLLHGRVSDVRYDDAAGIVSFSLAEERSGGDMRFPPVMATGGNFQDDKPGTATYLLNPEHEGRCFPTCVGECRKIPVLDLTSDDTESGFGPTTGKYNKFLVAGDWFGEFAAGSVVSVYFEDTLIAADLYVASIGEDDAGNKFVQVLMDAGSESPNLDVTVDFTGHQDSDGNATVGETIRHLLSFANDGTVLVDYASLRDVDREFDRVRLGIVFNDPVNGGVLDAIRERVIGRLPIVMLKRGSTYRFLPLTWGSPGHQLDLAYGAGIHDVAGTEETSREDVCNQFVVRYGRSGYRDGDSAGSVAKDWDSDLQCRRSEQRYGRREARQFDLGDVSDSAGASQFLDWTIETHSKVRVTASYLCGCGAILCAGLWDRVRILDEREGWDAEFKIVGISYRTGKRVQMDFLSVEDCRDVYNTA